MVLIEKNTYYLIVTRLMKTTKNIYKALLITTFMITITTSGVVANANAFFIQKTLK